MGQAASADADEWGAGEGSEEMTAGDWSSQVLTEYTRLHEGAAAARRAAALTAARDGARPHEAGRATGGPREPAAAPSSSAAAAAANEPRRNPPALDQAMLDATMREMQTILAPVLKADTDEEDDDDEGMGPAESAGATSSTCASAAAAGEPPAGANQPRPPPATAPVPALQLADSSESVAATTVPSPAASSGGGCEVEAGSEACGSTLPAGVADDDGHAASADAASADALGGSRRRSGRASPRPAKRLRGDDDEAQGARPGRRARIPSLDAAYLPAADDPAAAGSSSLDTSPSVSGTNSASASHHTSHAPSPSPMASAINHPSLAELNLTMEAALNALYDDSLASLGTPTPPRGIGVRWLLGERGGGQEGEGDEGGGEEGGGEEGERGAAGGRQGQRQGQRQGRPQPAPPQAGQPQPAPTPQNYSLHAEPEPQVGGNALVEYVEGAGKRSEFFTRSTWSVEEDQMILDAVAMYGPKWRKIAAELPNRSDDAVRNRWQRLTSNPSAYRASQPGTSDGMSTALTLLPQDMAALIHTQPPVYKCSRCGQPKKAHICTAPEKLSSAEMSRLKKELSDSKGGEAVRSVWTQEEDRVILAAVLELGPKWGEIAKRLAGRTDHATRNRYHRLTSRGAQVAAELALTDESIVAHPI